MRAASGTRPIVRGTSLAPEPSDFVGRAAELDALRRLFNGEARLLTIVGPRGIGKTRLARRYAGVRGSLGAGPVWFHDLCAVVDDDSLAAIVLAALNAKDEPCAHHATADAVGRALACREGALLVLDNAEHLLPSAARIIEAWSATAPDVNILVTSRVPLEAEGERLLQLGALGQSQRGELASDAVHLFLTRAVGTSGPPHGFALQEVARVVEDLDGVPLAIELAAAAAGPGVLGELGARRSPEASAVERGWSLLDVWRQEALSQCSVFRGGFTLEAASAVLLLPKGAPSTSDAVLELAQKSLLEVTRYDPLRFAMAESIRSHAALARAASGAGSVAERRHAQYYADLAAQVAGLRHAQTQEGTSLVPSCPRLAEAARERENLAAAMAYGAAADRPEIVVRAAAALEVVSLGNVLSRAELGALDRALASPSGLDPMLVQRALGVRAATMLALGSLALSKSDGLAALALAEKRGDVRHMTALHTVVATATFQEGDSATALAHLERALELLRGRSQPAAMVSVLHQLGSVHLTLGDEANARLHFEGALALAVEVGDGAGEARVANALGSYHLAYGELEDARRFYERAERIARALGMHRTLRIVTAYQGLLAFEEGDRERARWLFAAAVAACREAGDVRLEGFFEGFLAAAVASSGDTKEAGAAFASAERLLHENPLSLEVIALERGFLDLAEARRALARGDVARAREALRSARSRVHVASMPSGGTPPLLARSDDARLVVRILARELAGAQAPSP
jgi:tetratricopeptide (TPR) repeat protein